MTRGSADESEQSATERIFVEPPLSFALLESLFPIGGSELEDAVFGPVGEQVEGNEIRVLANMSREGGTLFLRQAHIQGPGPNTVGVKGLFDAAREFGRSQGVNKVVIEGAKRTTGAGNQRGAVPRIWEILVK